VKILARLEEFALVLLSIYLFSLLPYAWWMFPLFFFLPDISLLGTLAGKRAGAVTYNLFHHKAVSLGAYLLGSLLGIPVLAFIGVVLLGHSSFDRVVGLSLMDTSTEAQPAFRPFGQRT